MNIVYTGSVVASSAYAPRTTGPLVLEDNASTTTPTTTTTDHHHDDDDDDHDHNDDRHDNGSDAPRLSEGWRPVDAERDGRAGHSE